MKQRMHLAFDLSYIHMDGRWRMPGAWPGVTYPDVTMFEHIARIAERGKLDMLFSGDGTGVPSTWQGSRDAAVRWGVSWPRQDLAPLCVAMARVTQHLGFGVTYSTTFMHPYYLARLFNSLDHVTGGRIAFNVITSTRRSDYANYGYDERCPTMTNATNAWRSSSMCAARCGTASSRTRCCGTMQLARSAIRRRCMTSSIAGSSSRSAGRWNTPPSPQGRPLLLQAGGSPRGIRACAYVADMAFGADMPLSLQIAQREVLDAAVAAQGRDPQTMGIVWWQQPTVPLPRPRARRIAQRERLLTAIPPEGVGVYLSHNSGYDFATLPERFTLGELHREIVSPARRRRWVSCAS